MNTLPKSEFQESAKRDAEGLEDREGKDHQKEDGSHVDHAAEKLLHFFTFFVRFRIQITKKAEG